MNLRKHFTAFSVLFLLCGMAVLLTACGEIPLKTYDEIVDHLRILLTAETVDGSSAEPTNDPIKAALAEVAARCEDPTVMAYSLHDINDDGTEELILTEQSGTDIYAIFTMTNRNAVLLDVFKHGAIKQDGCIYYVKESEEQTTYNVKYLIDGALVGLTYGYNGTDPSEGGDAEYFRMDDGIRTVLTREEYLDLLNSHQFLFMPMHTKQTGMYITLLFPAQSQTTPPLLSVRTYDDVLALCRDILNNHHASYKRADWTAGAYDNLYTFEDARTYTLFSRLLYVLCEAGNWNDIPLTSQTLGYDILDLNSDGTDELVLMEEDYSLMAILTLRDNLPVLLLTPESTNYISADGTIHGTRNAPDNNASSAYQYCMWEI